VIDDELTPEEKFAAESAETKVPRELLEGRKAEEIIADLVRLDWKPDVARALVARVADDLRRYYESPQSRRQLIREARREFITGAIMALLALLVSLLTFFAAASGVISFWLLAGGLFFTGLIFLRRGWARWRLYRQVEIFAPQGRHDSQEGSPRNSAVP
jgi:cation transport ATPase